MPLRVGPFEFTLANPDAAVRRGRVITAAQATNVTRAAGMSCAVAPSPTAARVGPGGGGSTVLINSVTPTCAWTARSNDSGLRAYETGAAGEGGFCRCWPFPCGCGYRRFDWKGRRRARLVTHSVPGLFTGLSVNAALERNLPVLRKRWESQPPVWAAILKAGGHACTLAGERGRAKELFRESLEIQQQ